MGRYLATKLDHTQILHNESIHGAHSGVANQLCQFRYFLVRHQCIQC